MPLWLQLSNVTKNRWVGAYWQSKGLTVIPTISWGTASSFKFCFDGVEKNSIVAVGMIGSKKDNHFGFISGYNEMCERIIQNRGKARLITEKELKKYCKFLKGVDL